MRRLTDLREILRYVPQFRDKTFVIALDGAVVDDENFANIILDVALLVSLRISVVLVHGASHQIRRLAAQTGRTPSNTDGTGVTDALTLELALTAATRVTHEILEGLCAADLRGAYANSLVAHPAGILQGIDHQLTGRVERVDTRLLHDLLAREIIPVVPPLGCDGEGHTYRLNSDAVAVDVARALQAVKLIYLGCEDGISPGGGLVRQLSVEEAQTLLKDRRGELSPSAASKLAQAVRAACGDVPRVHIIDGLVQEGLLAEVFSHEGIGTLVHANEYQAIRRARRRDARAIFNLIQGAMESDELVRRTQADVERQIEDFYLFEVDGTPVGCVAVHFHPAESKAELASLCVDSGFENQGIGGKLVQYAEGQARARGAQEVFCLSTQAFNFFVHKAGFALGAVDDLPPSRRERYERDARRSQVLTKRL